MPIRGKEENSHSVFRRVCKQHHEEGQRELFKISGPATQVRIAAAEARGTLMMIRKMADAHSSREGPGLSVRRDEGSGWEWQKLHASAPPRTPSHGSIHSRLSPLRRLGCTGGCLGCKSKRKRLPGQVVPPICGGLATEAWGATCFRSQLAPTAWKFRAQKTALASRCFLLP